MTDSWVYRHVIGFEETNLVGNVYYVNYLRWQGRCREMFLRERAPEVLDELRADLKMFTLRVDCEFFTELAAFDELAIHLSLAEITQTQLQLRFDYRREPDGVPVARGHQRIACMRTVNGHAVPARVPGALVEALGPYRDLTSATGHA